MLLSPHYEDVDVVTDGQALLEVATSRQPDLILTDISLPRLDGLEITRRLRQALPELPVIILTRHAGLTYAQAAFGAGAWGYLVKTATPAELFRAIEVVLSGNLYLTPSVAGSPMSGISAMSAMLSPAVVSEPKASITPRERQIAELVAEGLETAEIATRLYIAEVTVRTHLRRTLRKLGLRNRVELARHILTKKSSGKTPPGVTESRQGGDLITAS